MRFKGLFYDQIDGVAMGSPLAPVLTNLFMGHHDRIWLENYSTSQILFYGRFSDDTFCLFEKETDAQLLFYYINTRHPSIRFTMEREVEQKLPFLDILLDNSNSSLITTVFRKRPLPAFLLTT